MNTSQLSKGRASGAENYLQVLQLVDFQKQCMQYLLQGFVMPLTLVSSLPDIKIRPLQKYLFIQGG